MSGDHKRRWISSLFRETLRAETEVPAGRINLFGLAASLGLFVVVGSVGFIFDAWQAFWRIFDDDYETGFPSVFSLFRLWALMFILCVVILAITGIIKPRA